MAVLAVLHAIAGHAPIVPRPPANGKRRRPLGFARTHARIRPMPRFAALLAAGCLCACAHGGAMPDLVGRLAPPLELTTFDGKPLRLVEPGRPTLLVFMASWCAPSKMEAGRLADLER